MFHTLRNITHARDITLFNASRVFRKIPCDVFGNFRKNREKLLIFMTLISSQNLFPSFFLFFKLILQNCKKKISLFDVNDFTNNTNQIFYDLIHSFDRNSVKWCAFHELTNQSKWETKVSILNKLTFAFKVILFSSLYIYFHIFFFL